MNDQEGLTEALKIVATIWKPTLRTQAVDYAVEAANLASIYLAAAMLELPDADRAQYSIDCMKVYLEDAVKHRLAAVEANGGPKSPFTGSAVNAKTREEVLAMIREQENGKG